MNLPGNEGDKLRTWNNSISRGTADELGAYIFPAGSIVFPKVGGALLTNKRRLTERPSLHRQQPHRVHGPKKMPKQEFLQHLMLGTYRIRGRFEAINSKPRPVAHFTKEKFEALKRSGQHSHLPRRTSRHRPVPRPRRRADPAVHRQQGAAHRPAWRRSGRHWSTRPSRGAWTPTSGSSPPEWSGWGTYQSIGG